MWISFAALRQPDRADIQPLIAPALCPHCLPLRVPETLTHMLLECPVAITVWDWICRLWAAYSGAQAPPATAAVLLADDQREWSPPQDLQASWLQLRIAAIAALSSAAPGTSHRGFLRGLDGGPRGQDGRQQRLAESGSRRPSSASQRHLLLPLAPRQASIHEPGAVPGHMGQEWGLLHRGRRWRQG